MVIEFQGKKGNISTFQHEYGLMFRVEWKDDTIDVLQKIDGDWKDITIIPNKSTKEIGRLIDEQLKQQV